LKEVAAIAETPLSHVEIRTMDKISTTCVGDVRIFNNPRLFWKELKKHVRKIEEKNRYFITSGN